MAVPESSPGEGLARWTPLGAAYRQIWYKQRQGRAEWCLALLGLLGFETRTQSGVSSKGQCQSFRMKLLPKFPGALVAAVAQPSRGLAPAAVQDLTLWRKGRGV